MRFTAIVITLTMLAVVASSAQAPAPAQQHPYGLDPYKPSDAALLRQFGAALVAQTPFSELRKLDPYTPSHAALLRQVGGAAPLWWGFGLYPPAGPAPAVTPQMPFPTADTGRPTGPQIIIIVLPNTNSLRPPRSLDRPQEPLPRPGPQGPPPTREATTTSPPLGAAIRLASDAIPPPACGSVEHPC